MSNPTKHIKQQSTWTYLVLLMVMLGIGMQFINRLDIKKNSTDYLLSTKKSVPTDCDNSGQPATPENSNSCEKTVIDFEEEVDDTHYTVDLSSKANQSGIAANYLTNYQEQHTLLFHPEAIIPPPKA